MESNWYAVYVRSRHEFKVSKALQSKKIEVFLPVVEKVRQWKDRKKRIEFPLFSGYLFVRLHDEKTAFLDVLNVNGVVKILGDSSGYKPVPKEQVSYIYTMVTSKLPINEHPYLKEGHKVKIIQGPLNGVEGILVRKAESYSVVVSVDILQKGVSVTVDINAVEPIE